MVDSPHVRWRTSPLSTSREGQSESCELARLTGIVGQGVSQENNEFEIRHFFILIT